MFVRRTLSWVSGSMLVVAACALAGCGPDNAGGDSGDAGGSSDSDGSSGSTGSGGAGDGTEQDVLLGGYTLTGSTGWEPLPDTKVRISFSDPGFGFSAGCNMYFAEEYSIEGGTFVAAGFGSTAAGCLQEGASEQDNWLSEFFTSGPAISHEAPRVTFTTEAVTLVFLEREIAEPDLSLIGTAWAIDTLITGEVAMTGPGFGALAFADDDTFSIDGPCNIIAGSFTSGAGTLTFSDVFATEAGCSDASDAATEAHLLEVFADGSVTYDVNVARLSIMRGEDLGVMAHGGE